ncbi:MAG: carboxypeptidase regulatory-like domain-containing protein [Solirubrobacteraceae bacterium]
MVVALIAVMAGNARADSTGSISGTIRDASGALITTQDICVQAESMSDGNSSDQVTTDASGNYMITGLVADSYEVYVQDCAASSRDDVATPYSSGDDSGPFVVPTAVVLTDGQAATGIDVQLATGTSIRGHVYGGAGTSTPVGDMCVSATDDLGPGSTTAVTGPDGAYTLTHLAPGDGYQIEFDPCGSDAAWAPQYYDGASSTQSATLVTPTVANPATGIDGHLPAGAAISGTITDANRNPITSLDVCVDVSSSGTGDDYGSATTDGSGSFEISGLAAGSYTVSAADCVGSTRNDVPTTYSTAQDGSATAVTASAGQVTSGINVELQAGTTISGHVYGGNGSSTPLDGVCVDVDPVSEGGDGGETATQTAADGSYTVDNVAPGVGYKLQFFACSQASTYVSEYYNDVYSYADATTVTPPAAGASGIDGHLPVGGSLSGTVNGADGHPITSQDVCVTLDPVGSDGMDASPVTTDASGDYQFVGLNAGSYKVQVQDCSGSGRNDLPGESATAVAVSLGQAATGVDVQLAAGTSISGHVYGGSGTSTPLARATVQLLNASTGSPADGFAKTAADGSYTIGNLPPDVGYKVQFTPGSLGSTYTSEYYDGASDLAGASVLTPTVASPSTGIDGNLPGGASITGTVHDAGGTAITTGDICVQTLPDGGGDSGDGYGQARTDSYGGYTITGLPAGTYYVEFSDCSDSLRNDLTQYYGGNANPSDSTVVVLSAGGNKTGVDASMQAGTSIEGHVYGGDTNTPLANACVVVNVASPSNTTYYYYYQAQTDGSGAYEIGHVAPGIAYMVQFTDCNHPATYVSQYYDGASDPSAATTLTPTVQVPATGVDAHLAGGNSISGTVSDSNGHPITSGVCVSAVPALTDDYSVYYSDGLASDGSYTIDTLPAGSYHVTFSDCSGRNDITQTLPGSVTVAPGQAVQGIDATMQPATSISGHVYSGQDTSSPLGGLCVAVLNPDGSPVSASGSIVETAGDGSYTFDHLDPAGSYVVEFDTCSLNGSARQYYDGVSDLSQADVLTPTLASPSTGIDAHLPSAPVTTITGGPANNAATSQTDVTFAFTANMAGATFVCSLDFAPYTSCSSPFDSGQLTSAEHEFSVEATAGGGTETSPPMVHFTVDPTAATSTAQGSVTLGGTFSSDPGATTTSSTTPVILAVTPPAASQVTLTTQPTTTPSPNGYTVFGQQLQIAAADPDGTGSITGTAAAPIKLEFTLDASQIPAGSDLSSITVTRNGTPAADCNSQNGTADPDPCVESRTPLTNGGVELVVLTTHCSTWNFATTSTPTPAPVNATPPSISGTTTVGQPLTEAHGSWSGNPTADQYQWQDCDLAGNNCSVIPGATGQTYTLASSDIGRTIVVEESALNSTGTSQPASSSPTTVVQAQPGVSLALALALAPSSIVANGSSQSIATVVVAEANGNPVLGDSVTLSASDGAVKLGAVTDHGDGTYTATITSSTTAHAVTITATDSSVSPNVSGQQTLNQTLGAPGNISAPAISGEALQGQTLTEAHGGWTGSPTSYGYQWERCDSSGTRCSAISAETGRTDALNASDVGYTIRVQETATNAGGTSGLAASAATALVAATGGAGGGSVTAAQINAAMLLSLTVPAKFAKIATISKADGFVLSFKALEAGRAIVSWYQVPQGATLASANSKAKPMLVATGRLSFTKAETGKLKMTLSVAGKKLLRSSKSLKLTAKGAFIPTAGTTITTTKTFTLKH